MKIRYAFPLSFGREGTTAGAVILALVALLPVAGCSGSGDLSKEQDDELRNNFTRKLTPEEIARLGGGKPAAPPKKGG